jgi:hypothetical protein
MQSVTQQMYGAARAGDGAEDPRLHPSRPLRILRRSGVSGMWDNVIGMQVRRANRNLAATNVVLLLAVGAAGLLSWRYLDSFLRGPFPLSASALAAAGDPAGLAHEYVTLQGTRQADTGVAEVQQQVDASTGAVTSEATVAHYLALLDGGQLVVVKARDAAPHQLSFTGVLRPLPADIAARVVQAAEAQAGAVGPRFAPVMLDATGDFRQAGWIGLAIALPLLALGVWNLWRVAARQDPEAHPSVQALARYGAPQSVAEAIESEMRGGESETVGGHTTLTAHWLLYRTIYGFSVVSLAELVWLYEKVTTTKYMGVIPMGKRREAVLLDAKRKVVRIGGRKGVVESLLQQAGARAPWAAAGFSAQIQQAAQKDFPALAAAVAARRAGAQAGRAGGANM